MSPCCSARPARRTLTTRRAPGMRRRSRDASVSEGSSRSSADATSSTGRLHGETRAVGKDLNLDEVRVRVRPCAGFVCIPQGADRRKLT